jgi:hypothetical protein
MAERHSTSIYHSTYKPNQSSIIVDLSFHGIISDKVYDGYGYPLHSFKGQEAANALPFKYAPFLDSIREI